VSSYVLAFVGFSLLIVLHEFGHFSVAKLTGMRVERFALFFPPLIVKVRRGETEYGIGAIPLGGYVKITGMNPEEKLPPEVAARAYYAQPVWKRVVVILAGPFMNLLIAFFLLFGLAFGAVDALSTKVNQVTPGSAAATALKPGDRIVSVDGVHGPRTDDEARLLAFRRQISSHHCAGKPVSGCVATTAAAVQVVRDGRLVTLRIHPRYDAQAQAKRTLLGFRFGAPLNPSAPQAASTSLDLMWAVTKETLGVVVRIFEPEKRKELSSVVGGYEVTRQSFSEDIRRALTLLAVISLSLALINLFPFLPLDGGHVFWGLVEKVRGKPVPFRVIEQASVVGFMIVVFFFLIGFTNDIDRLSGGGFQTR
jgi:regulator of sigma E protease